MATEMRRMMVAIPSDLEDKLTAIKQAEFFGDSWAEMIRVLLQRAVRQTLRELESQ